MKFETIKVNLSNRILTVKLNRSEKRNALNPQMILELTNLFEFYKKNKNCKVVILEGKGTSFCAGMDLAVLKSFKNYKLSQHLSDAKKLVKLLSVIYEFPKLTIAKIKGEAFAGGAGLAVVCDLICATNNAKFAFTEVKIGFVPAIISFFVKKKIASGVVNELLLTGRIFDSNEAMKIGFVNHIFSENEIDSKLLEMAEKICESASQNSIIATKQILNKISSTEKKALSRLAKINAKIRLSHDCKKGVEKFLSKKKLTW